jgi:hypothetical protein
MATGKNTDDVPELIADLLERNGVVPTKRIVEDLRRLVVEIAAQEKSRVTDPKIKEYFARIGLRI